MQIRLPPDYDPRVSVATKHADNKKLYLFYYLPDGTRRNQSTKTSSKMQAAAIARQKEQDLLAGRFDNDELAVLGPSFGSAELTIDKAVERYLTLTAPNKSPKTNQTEHWDIPRTFRYFKKWGATLLMDVTPVMVNDLLFKEKAHVAPATRRTLRNNISKVFAALIQEGSFDHINPVARSQRFRVKKSQAQREVWIPYEQFVKLLAAAEQVRTPLVDFADMLELNWELALRRDEMLTLEWWQFDRSNRLLRIVNKPEFPTPLGKGWSPKWGKERTLPLTDKAVEILDRVEHRLTYAKLGKGKDAEIIPVNLIFPQLAGRKDKKFFLRCSEFKHAWHSMKNAAGLGHVDYQWHDFRRSWNRYAAEQGIPTPYRAAFLGHRIEVNEGNYETPMGFEFMRAKMGNSMAEAAQQFATAVPNLFQLPVAVKRVVRK